MREAIVNHPDILVEASDALRDRQYAPTLAAQRASIETPFHSSWKGAAKPDVTLAYYYDYACGYCRKSNPDIDRLLAEDKGLRVVFHELPILGPGEPRRVARRARRVEGGQVRRLPRHAERGGQSDARGDRAGRRRGGRVARSRRTSPTRKPRSSAISRSRGSWARPARPCSWSATG